MKNLLVIFVLFIVSIQANAAVMKYSDAYEANDTKPMAVLVYANWAENYAGIYRQFRAVQQEMGDKYNYVELNIADRDTKDYLEKNVILTNPPYIMLYRGKCKFARIIEGDCASSSACIISKMKSFMR